MNPQKLVEALMRLIEPDMVRTNHLGLREDCFSVQNLAETLGTEIADSLAKSFPGEPLFVPLVRAFLLGRAYEAVKQGP